MNKKKLKTQINTLRNEIAKFEKDSANPNILTSPDKLKEITTGLSKKQKELDILLKLKKTQMQLEETKQMVESEKDKEMLELVKSNIQELKLKEEEILKKLEEIKSGEPAEEVKECILEIRAGTGGEESNIFAADLFRMYAKYAESKKWRVSILSKNQTGTGGFKEIIAQINGKGAYTALQHESGVHRVQRVPATESSGRIHTSAASVVMFPLKEESEINIAPSDLKIDVYRSSGPGGQSVNTTDSAVRITHIPTGTIVACQDEKSQHKNKKKAMSVLASRLASLHKEEQQSELSKVRKDAIKTGDRSAKIRTYNFPQSRVTDHRIKKSWHNLKGIMDGDLDQVIEILHKSF